MRAVVMNMLRDSREKKRNAKGKTIEKKHIDGKGKVSGDNMDKSNKRKRSLDNRNSQVIKRKKEDVRVKVRVVKVVRKVRMKRS